MALSALIALVTGVLIGALSANGGDGPLHQWQDADLGPSIAEGVATERYVWLRGWNGGLVRFDRETGDRVVLGAQVRDILADGPHLWAISMRPDGSTFELRDLRAATLPPRSGEVSGDLLHLVRMADGVGVLTQDAIFLPSSGGLSRRGLATPLSGQILAAANLSGSIYAGANWGEFGGRLTRIDPRDGSTREITRLSASQEAAGWCDGDFNPGCDPIMGVLPDPERPDCIIAASGQFHMGLTHGKVYRVCGDVLTLIFRTPNRTPLLWRLLTPTEHWRDLGAPIERLVQTADGWVAISTDRYFRMQDGEISEHAMPPFHPWSGLYLSDEQDGVLLAVAACCSGPMHNRQQLTVAIPVVR